MASSRALLPEHDSAPASTSIPAPAVQLATLAEVGAQIGSARTVEDVLRLVSREARWMLTFNRCSLALVTPDGDHYRVYTLNGRSGTVERTTPLPMEQSLVGNVLARRQPLRIEDITTDDGQFEAGASLFAPDTRSALLLPLVAEGEVLGTLSFCAPEPRAFPGAALTVGRLLALQVAGAARNALLLDALDGQETVILSLALAIEAKDPYTEGHCRRLAQYAESLGRVLGLDTPHLNRLRMGAMLHDVGKIAVPEAILNKPGALTPEEFAAIQQHPVVGEQICRPLRTARTLLPAIRHHHERWDGQGYPDGLAGEAIPFDARIIAMVDAFDAMTSDRPYRLGLPTARAVEIMRANRGPQWDPELLGIFLQLVETGMDVRQAPTETLLSSMDR